MALDLDDIRQYINTQLDKHESGNSYSPSEFNALIAVENINFFNHKIDEMQNAARSDKDFMEMLLSSKLLRPLLAAENVTPTTGVYDLTGLSNTFVHWVSATTTAVFNGKITRVELVNHNEYEKRQVNMLSPPIYYHPIAELVGDNLNILPTNITQIKLTYVKLPSTPFFDYYIDANRNVVFLAEGGSVDLDVVTGTYRDGSTTGSHNSTTNELDYGQEFYPDFTEYLLSRLGVRTRETMIVQTSEQEKLKDSV